MARAPVPRGKGLQRPIADHVGVHATSPAPEQIPPPIALRTRRGVWRDLARILSTVCNPFLTSLALFVILAATRARGTTDFWILLFNSAFFTSIGPMLMIFALYAMHRISDLDMSIRSERARIFGAFVLFYGIGVLDLWSIDAPKVLTATMAALTASSIVIYAITRWWKISTHAFGITAPIVALTILFGERPLPFAILIPLIGWARVYLRAHTLAQVLAGSALGAMATLGFFRAFRIF